MRRGTPTIALCMIVRDESGVIERCLDSVRPVIDHWVICDTGSTDDTPKIIQERLGDIPGRLEHSEWVDFGHNRSELMRLARGSADYLLLIDADMTLVIDGPPGDLDADAYLVRETGQLDFGVLRLVRGDRDWWYEGATHEFLCTDGQFSQEELPTWTVEHHADGSSREGKLLRDLGLLRRDLAKGSSTPRTTFYLAQTYRDLGRREAAIEWYRRRVELGGWDEEVFYANLQEGVLRLEDGLGPATAVLIEAWQRRSARAEPLYELARAHRERGSMFPAHLFASRGLQIPYPADILFVHRWIYTWGLRIERAVAAAAIGRLEEARDDFATLLETDAALPGDIQAFAQSRLAELETRLGTPTPQAANAMGQRGAANPRAEPLRLGSVAPSLRIGELKLDVRPAWPAFNPSICADGDGFLMIVRTANYRIEEGVVHDDGILRNINYLVRIGPDLSVEGIEPIEEAEEPRRRYPSQVIGYEDCRLFEVDGQWFASATGCELNPVERREIVLLSLDGAAIRAIRPLSGPHAGRHEKNWMPFVRDGVLHFVYSCGPTVVLGCDPQTGRTWFVSETPAPARASELRGGSQGIVLDDGSWLFTVHEVDRSSATARYLHRFVRLDRELRLDRVSQPFTFTSDRVEFCGGMARRADQLVLSFGVSDAASGLAVVELGEVLELLDIGPYTARQ